MKEYVEDPLILVGKVRARTSNELLKVGCPFAFLSRLHLRCNTDGVRNLARPAVVDHLEGTCRCVWQLRVSSW